MIEVRAVHTDKNADQHDLLLCRIDRIDNFDDDDEFGDYHYQLVVSRGGHTHGVVEGIVESFSRKKFNFALLFAEILGDMDMEACKLDETLSANMGRTLRRALSAVQAGFSELRNNRSALRGRQSE